MTVKTFGIGILYRDSRIQHSQSRNLETLDATVKYGQVAVRFFYTRSTLSLKIKSAFSCYRRLFTSKKMSHKYRRKNNRALWDERGCLRIC